MTTYEAPGTYWAFEDEMLLGVDLSHTLFGRLAPSQKHDASLVIS